MIDRGMSVMLCAAFPVPSSWRRRRKKKKKGCSLQRMIWPMGLLLTTSFLMMSRRFLLLTSGFSIGGGISSPSPRRSLQQHPYPKPPGRSHRLAPLVGRSMTATALVNTGGSNATSSSMHSLDPKDAQEPSRQPLLKEDAAVEGVFSSNAPLKSGSSYSQSSTLRSNRLFLADQLTLPVHEFSSAGEFLEALEATGQEGNEQVLLVVKYYASYCKICQRAGISYKKIATEFLPLENAPSPRLESIPPDSADSETDTSPSPSPPTVIRCTKLEASRVGLSSEQLRLLGVVKFPFVQVYRQGACVASFSTGPSHLFQKLVRDTLDTSRRRTWSEWETQIMQPFAAEIRQNQAARAQIRQQQQLLLLPAASGQEDLADPSKPLPRSQLSP